MLFARLVELEAVEGAGARAERQELVVELDRVGQELRALDEHPSAVLDAIRIHRPCPASWEHMLGTDRVRHCGTCDTEVYDLTAMDAEEVDAFLAERTEACVRLHARRDGRHQRSSCGAPPRPTLLRASAVAIALGLGAAAVLLREPPRHARFAVPDDSDLVMGGVSFGAALDDGPPLANLKPGLARAF